MDDLVDELSKSPDESIANTFLHTLDFIAAVFLQRKDIDAEDRRPSPVTQIVEKIRQGIETFSTHLSRLNEHLFTLLSSDTIFVDSIVSFTKKTIKLHLILSFRMPYH